MMRAFSLRLLPIVHLRSLFALILIQTTYYNGDFPWAHFNWTQLRQLISPGFSFDKWIGIVIDFVSTHDYLDIVWYCPRNCNVLNCLIAILWQFMWTCCSNRQDRLSSSHGVTGTVFSLEFLVKITNFFHLLHVCSMCDLASGSVIGSDCYN